jgi:stage V sporulation protein B
MIKGMALPILFFPSTLISSVSVLLLPEMSEAKALGRKALVKSATEKIITLTLLVGFFCGAVFLFSGQQIGTLLYKSKDVGFLLCALSPIVPMMYLDGICDGILKGLDCQRFTFFSSVGDSVLRLILIPLILPRYSVTGFIGIMYFSNFFTCALNCIKLITVSDAKINIFKTILLPLFLSLVAVFGCDKLLSLIPNLPLLVYIILVCGISLSLYIIGVFAFKCITKEDLKDIV